MGEQDHTGEAERDHEDSKEELENKKHEDEDEELKDENEVEDDLDLCPPCCGEFELQRDPVVNSE